MENKEIKIAILGGDLRQVKMASLLKSEGYQAVLYGFDDSQIEDTSLLTPSLKDAVVGRQYGHFRTSCHHGWHHPQCSAL